MDNVAQAIREFVNNSLGVNPIEMVIQIASTIVLFLVIRFTFWKNITAYLESRKEAMANEYSKAEEANKEAETLKVQVKDELQDIRQSAKGMYEEAKVRGEEERKDIVNNAKKEADRLVENAHLEIENEVEKARTDINNEIVSVATMMAQKIIKKEIDPKKHKELMKDVTSEVMN